jgi:hypothetical protein
MRNRDSITRSLDRTSFHRFIVQVCCQPHPHAGRFFFKNSIAIRDTGDLNLRHRIFGLRLFTAEPISSPALAHRSKELTAKTASKCPQISLMFFDFSTSPARESQRPGLAGCPRLGLRLVRPAWRAPAPKWRGSSCQLSLTLARYPGRPLKTRGSVRTEKPRSGKLAGIS